MTAIATPRLKNQEPISQPLLTDQWISATWEEFVQILENPLYADSRCYYDKNQFRQMRIETELVNSAHALDHGMTLFAISLYCTLAAAIPARGLINCSYTKTGVQGCQPDISYYIGESASLVPRSNFVVNLDEFAVPNLVIEISSSTLGDDLGKKRLLYEQLGTNEYWVVDVQEVRIIAFEMLNGGSRQITESKLLGGLAIADLEFALRLSREKSQSEVGAWLLQKYSDR
ncbi:Uma2 family endonuclease [Pseudanabaena sp. Chao 1811]|uniref:Uma2 family endonuclease n=1 Tax=Pseudanabaena sp. Chao 1811 TaxID=2963092 RepID=UPI0022F384A6|nr:Uma2 family endonuclease [Pseudanabaena sp. Chao 1811]